MIEERCWIKSSLVRIMMNIEPIKRIHNYRTKKCNAVLKSTANTWMRIRDTPEDNGINTILTNTYKTKIIVQAR
ncbi:MAG TPA: hypothetical protein VLA74_12280 [Nitrososphaeraceae archaeon]|nr:hypothetical protein [Nitrososphaeraceae archaeon]